MLCQEFKRILLEQSTNIGHHLHLFLQRLLCLQDKELEMEFHDVIFSSCFIKFNWKCFEIIVISLVLTLTSLHQAANNTSGEREKSLQNLQEISGEGNVESLIWVEKGLRELASLKVKKINMINSCCRLYLFLEAKVCNQMIILFSV